MANVRVVFARYDYDPRRRTARGFLIEQIRGELERDGARCELDMVALTAEPAGACLLLDLKSPAYDWVDRAAVLEAAMHFRDEAIAALRDGAGTPLPEKGECRHQKAAMFRENNGRWRFLGWEPLE